MIYWDTFTSHSHWVWLCLHCPKLQTVWVGICRTVLLLNYATGNSLTGGGSPQFSGQCLELARLGSGTTFLSDSSHLRSAPGQTNLRTATLTTKWKKQSSLVEFYVFLVKSILLHMVWTRDQNRNGLILIYQNGINRPSRMCATQIQLRFTKGYFDLWHPGTPSPPKASKW